MSAETDSVERGSATASGLCDANHLSPEYFSGIESLNRTSPAGRTFLSWETFFEFEAFMKMAARRNCFALERKSFGRSGRRVVGIEKRPCFSSFAFQNLHANAARGLGVALHAQRRQLAYHHGVKTVRLQARTRQLGLGHAECLENSHEGHTFTCVISPRGSVGAGCKSAKTITPAPVWSVLCTCASTWCPIKSFALLMTT